MVLYTQIKGKPDQKNIRPVIQTDIKNIIIIRKGNQKRRKRP